MQLLKKISGWFGSAKSEAEVSVPVDLPEAPEGESKITEQERIARRVFIMNQLGLPFVADRNYMTLFHTVPEVFFPIDFIARRIAGAHFEIKSYKDDSILYCSGHSPKANRMNAILTAPNCLQRWREVVYMHITYKLATGNAFMRAAMSDTFANQPKWKYCNNFWSIPPQMMTVVPISPKTPMWGIAKLDEIVGHYDMQPPGQSVIKIPTYQVWHDRDLMPQFMNTTTTGFLKSRSRLQSVHRAISNLLAVYEARNVIYVKRGAIGFLVSKNEAGELGTVAMKPDEKDELLKDLNGRYNLTDQGMPVGITDRPLEFVKVNADIQALQPFEETLLDAITIAGAYGIPAVLVPRKDQATFSNQATAEKSVYTGTIIPMAKQFCEDLTLFLGLDMEGYYVDVNFSDVDCLQIGLKEAEEVKKLVNDRCLLQFSNGLITYNDWRAQIHESAMEGEIYNKTKFEMTPEELEKIEKIIKPNNSKPSTGESNGSIEKNPLSDKDS